MQDSKGWFTYEKELSDAIETYGNLKEQQAMIQTALSQAEMDICKYMERNIQTEFKTKQHKVTIKRDKRGCPVTFMQEFGELDSISKKQFDDIYTPEHEETKIIPAKINLAKIRKLKKYGAEIWNRADRAILKGDWRISAFKQLEKEN